MQGKVNHVSTMKKSSNKNLHKAKDSKKLVLQPALRH